jgi:hypothetical protein
MTVFDCGGLKDTSSSPRFLAVRSMVRSSINSSGCPLRVNARSFSPPPTGGRPAPGRLGTPGTAARGHPHRALGAFTSGDPNSGLYRARVAERTSPGADPGVPAVVPLALLVEPLAEHSLRALDRSPDQRPLLGVELGVRADASLSHSRSCR